jgi:hypothetical protein
MDSNKLNNDDFWNIIGLYLKILDNSKYQSLRNWLKVLWSIYRKRFSINLKFRSLSMHVNWCDVRFERTLLDIDKLPSNPFALEMLFKPSFNVSTLTVRSVTWYRIPYQLLHILPNSNSLFPSNILMWGSSVYLLVLIRKKNLVIWHVQWMMKKMTIFEILSVYIWRYLIIPNIKAYKRNKLYFHESW